MATILYARGRFSSQDLKKNSIFLIAAGRMLYITACAKCPEVRYRLNDVCTCVYTEFVLSHGVPAS